MRRMFWVILLSLAGFFFIMGGVSLRADVEEGGRKAIEGEGREAWQKEIEAKLAQPTTFDFKETPFEEVIGFFRSVGDLNIVVDRRYNPGEELVNMQLLGVPIGESLSLLLEQFGLYYEIKNHAVFITASEELREWEEDLILAEEKRASEIVGKINIKFPGGTSFQLPIMRKDIPEGLTKELLEHILEDMMEEEEQEEREEEEGEEED